MTPRIPSTVSTLFSVYPSPCYTERSVRGERMCFFLNRNKEQMGNIQIFIGIGWNFKILVMRNIQILLSSLSQTCHLSTDTHTPTIPEFILSVSNWNRHYLADEIIQIPESPPGCASSPACKSNPSGWDLRTQICY